MDEFRKQVMKAFVNEYPQYAEIVDFYENYIQGYILGCSEAIINSVHALVLTINTALDYVGSSLFEWDYYKEILANATEDEGKKEE